MVDQTIKPVVPVGWPRQLVVWVPQGQEGAASWLAYVKRLRLLRNADNELRPSGNRRSVLRAIWVPRAARRDTRVAMGVKQNAAAGNTITGVRRRPPVPPGEFPDALNFVVWVPKGQEAVA